MVSARPLYRGSVSRMDSLILSRRYTRPILNFKISQAKQSHFNGRFRIKCISDVQQWRLRNSVRGF